jgi:hypothetical protein
MADKRQRNNGGQAKKRTVEVIRDEKASPVYANNVVIELTPWDVKFRFGEILEASATALRTLERVAVVMSPQHALVLSKILNRHLDTYQTKYGPIPLAPGQVTETSTEA